MSRREEYPQSQPQPGDKVFWKSLEAKADPEGTQKRATAEFPEREGLDVDKGALDRRGFLTLGAITSALFAEGCARRPLEKILPYTKAPEYALPGIPRHYATAHAHRGDAIGLVIETHEGRPTKVEGNPDHPSSLGATDTLSQAMLFDLYDPDRSRKPRKGVKGAGGPANHADATWADVDAALAELVRNHGADRGAKLRILVQPTTSPTYVRIRQQVLGRYPQAKVYSYAPVFESETREASRIAFGQPVNAVYDYAQAKTILAVDSDFLGSEPGSVRASRAFSSSRRVRSPQDGMSRLYVVEPSLTQTGTNADHRLRLSAGEAEGYLLALAKELLGHGVDLGDIGALAGAAKGIPEKWTKVVAKDLLAARGRSVVVVGSRQPARVQALGFAINAALGNVGQTVQLYAVADPTERHVVTDIKQLATDISGGLVSTLVVLGGNPVFDAPSDLKFGELLGKVDKTFHLGSHFDETSQKCLWHLPLAHELETWGDHVALDGTKSVQQPMIQPIHGGRSEIEVLARIAGEPSSNGADLVKATVRVGLVSTLEFEKVWAASLKRGVIAFPVAPFRADGPAKTADIANALRAGKPAGAPTAESLEVTFAPDAKIFDGRHANNPWLQELPDPTTKITWDNVALFSPATAKAIGVENGEMIRLSREGATPIDIAVWVQPGQGDNTVALALGWGRQDVGRYGAKHGFDVYPLRTTTSMGFASGVKLTKLSAADIDAMKDKVARPGLAGGPSPAPGRTQPDDAFEVETNRYKISQTQDHHQMEGRPIAIDATLAEYKKNPRFVRYEGEGRRSGSPDPKVLPLWKKRDYNDHKWGMTVDLNACTGCNVCVIACQAENNVPSVGKEQISRGREMFWIRIDRYFVGKDENDPEVALQPVACVQCEEAPCENVCPVNATAHSPEGLNDMAYNRCIGTRYCANNCPYKVRRFNFLNYNGDDGKIPDTEQMGKNPNVTVRFRGVMEKCTYCVQRIQEGKIKAKRESREMKDGDVVTACEQACPSQAIVFGDLNDPKSRVAELTKLDRNYRLLAELGTGPRTTYLGKLRNPNPEMA